MGDWLITHDVVLNIWCVVLFAIVAAAFEAVVIKSAVACVTTSTMRKQMDATMRTKIQIQIAKIKLTFTAWADATRDFFVGFIIVHA